MPDYYEINAKNYFAQTFQADMTEAYEHFLPKLACGSRILDFGFGKRQRTGCSLFQQAWL